MAVFAVLIRFSLHNFALWGDCWYDLDRLVFNPPWEAFKLFARHFGRPGEVVYYIPMFKLVGFNAQAWLLMSFFWLGAASLICGWCLRRSFPDLQLLHIGVPLITFFGAALGPLVYRMDLDQGRLCMLFFWISAACYQSFLLRRGNGLGRSVVWLLLADLAYLYSLLSYEASLLLFVGIAILLVPLWLRLDGSTKTRSFFEVTAMLVLVPTIYLWIRYALLSGGKDKPLRNIPRLNGFSEAARNVVGYLLAPLQHIQWDAATTLAMLASAGAIGFLLFGVARLAQPREVLIPIRRQAFIAIACGTAIFFGGISPFLLGIYIYDRVEFAGHGRQFASAWYGFAMVLVAALSIVRARPVRWIAAAVLTVVTAAGATLTYDLHRDWETAADINAQMWLDFFRQVPAVEPESAIIFKDLYSGIPVKGGKGNRAFVSGSFSGMRDFIRIAYNDETLEATYLFTDARTKNAKYRMTASGAGPVLSASALPASKKVYPGGRYILVERKGYTLNVVDRWTPQDVGPGVEWKDGATHVDTNRGRIKRLPPGDSRTPEQRVRDLGYKVPASADAIRKVYIR